MARTSARKIAVVAWMLAAATIAAACGPGAPPAKGGSEPAKSADGARPGATDAELREDIARLTAETAALQEKIDALNAKNRALCDMIEAGAAANVSETPAVSPPKRPLPGPPESDVSIKGVVQAVDNKVDVCVISAGSKDGVLVGMECVVTRDGEAVATLVIDKVFPNYASGSRRPGAAKKDIRPGDACTLVPSAVTPPR